MKTSLLPGSLAALALFTGMGLAPAGAVVGPWVKDGKAQVRLVAEGSMPRVNSAPGWKSLSIRVGTPIGGVRGLRYRAGNRLLRLAQSWACRRRLSRP